LLGQIQRSESLAYFGEVNNYNLKKKYQERLVDDFPTHDFCVGETDALICSCPATEIELPE
jgi:hypothetical protein